MEVSDRHAVLGIDKRMEGVLDSRVRQYELLMDGRLRALITDRRADLGFEQRQTNVLEECRKL